MLSSAFCTLCGAALPEQATSCPVCGQSLQEAGLLAPSQPSAQRQAIEHRPSPQLTRRYRVLGKIGEGGFGVVYKARDRQHGRLVAIKQITLAALSAQEMIEVTDSFNREITLLPKLHHMGLPRLYDHFTDPEHWYIVMEYIEGETLDQTLAKTGRLPVAQVLTIAESLCDVLGYLHNQSPPVIFRDVKPANIMMDRWGRIHLIDFGIARRYREDQSPDTGPLGSPGFAAPEQYGSRAYTTPQTDLYGLGATLQTLLTGREPQEIRKSGRPADCILPRRLQELIEQMMDPDAAMRPPSMRHIKSYLQPIRVSLTYSHYQPLRPRKPVSPFAWLSTLWLFFIMSLMTIVAWVVISTPVVFVPVLLALFTIAGVTIYHYYKDRSGAASKLTKKDLPALLKNGLSHSSRWAFHYFFYFWLYGFFLSLPLITSRFGTPSFFIIFLITSINMGFLFIGLAGFVVIEKGRFLPWLRQVWVERRRQPPQPPPQQQARRDP